MTDTCCLGESEDTGSNPKPENDNSCIKNSDRPYQTPATCVVPNIACPDDIEVMGSNFIHVPSNIHTVHSPNEQNYCSPETADQTISVVHHNPVVYTQGVNHTEVMGLNPNINNNYQSVQDKCHQQIGDQFGCFPLNYFITYQGPGIQWDYSPDVLEAHRLIRASGVPNFLGLRIPVKTNLNVSSWKKHLNNYFDQQLPDLIQFGFPLDFNRKVQLSSTYRNHASALEYSSHVDHYIQDELKHGAILGPFNCPPISLHISPFMTRPKADSAVRRTIVDLNWPKGHSVNDGVGKQSYLGTDFLLKYPSIDSII